MAENSDNKLVWFFAGAAIGASVALLYAPEKGHVTRRRLYRKTLEGRDALIDTSREAYEKSRDLYEKGRKLADEAAEMFERGRKLVEG